MSAKAEGQYTEAVGRRKTATARVRITSAKSSSMMVNGKAADEYFPLSGMVKTAFSPKTVSGEKAVFTIPDNGKYSSAALPLTIIEELFAEVIRTRAVAVFLRPTASVYCPSAFALILLIR